MTFSNLSVNLGELPDASDIIYEALPHRYAVMVALVTAALILALGLSILGVLSLEIVPPPTQDPSLFALGIACAAFIAIAIIAYMYYAAKAIGYAVREHDIVLREGLLWRKQTIQPLIRLQHIELSRGPLEKRIGLANLSLFSAGTGLATFKIPGLPLRRAAALRKYVLQSQLGG